MKALTKLALATVLLTTAAAAQAQMVRGYLRSNDTYVSPYYRTPANGTPYDNLSYPGCPSQKPGYVAPGTVTCESTLKLPNYGLRAGGRRSWRNQFMNGLQTMPKLNSSYRIRTLGSK